MQKLSSSVEGIESLINSKDPIGYQQNSYARNYLVEELGIQESRLVPLNMPEDYAVALKKGPGGGGVAAVVDERAYVDLFLSTRCEFSIVGSEFTKAGWGFVSFSLSMTLYFPVILDSGIYVRFLWTSYYNIDINVFYNSPI